MKRHISTIIKNTLMLLGRINFKKEFNIKNTIAVFGSPRSGTTWLMELLSLIPKYITLFEPLQPIWFPEVVYKMPEPKPFLLPFDKSPKYKNYLTRVFTGNISSLRPQYRLNLQNISKRLNSDKLIVKFVRANRIIPWISNNFDLRAMIIIIRNPFAVISSQIRTGITGYTDKNRGDYIPSKKMFIEEVQGIKILDINIINKLKRINSNIEILAANWALDQYIPINYYKKYPLYKIKYENLIINGKHELLMLFKYLDEYKTLKKAINNLNKASMLTLSKDYNSINNAEYQLNKWKNYLSQNQINKINNILNYFNLDLNLENDIK